MRILVVTQYFWPENFKINDLVLGLKERGHDVIIFTGKPNYPQGSFFSGYSFWNKNKEYWNDIPVYRSPLFPRGKSGGIRLILNFFSFALIASAKAIFFKEKTDCILVYEPSPITVGIPAIVLKWKIGCPLYFWVQDLWPKSIEVLGNIKNKKIISLVDKLTRWIYSKSDKLLLQSEGFKEYILKQNVDEKKLIFYPNSTESFYKPVKASGKYQHLFNGKINILFAGNIGEAQGFETIVRAASIVKQETTDIHWVIVGTGRLKNAIERKVVEEGISDVISFPGSFPSEEMPDMFAHADALLVTLKRDIIFALTIPSKLQSYMACGKPIIASLDGEGAKIIKEANCGYVSSSDDAEALAANVISFSQTPDYVKQQMGEDGITYFNREFERELLLDRLINILSERVRRNDVKQSNY